MSVFLTRPVPANFKDAHVNADSYQAMYRRSMEDPEGFWAEMANSFLSWDQTWERVVRFDFTNGDAEWFGGGKLNVCYNCIDRHLPHRAHQTALIWEGDSPADSKHISYGELHEHVCKLANTLKARGVRKGDRVCIYMPMIPEAAYAMLACTRIGAVHSVVFGGFSPEALKDRILDSDCQTLITADEGVRVNYDAGNVMDYTKGKVDPLEDIKHCPELIRSFCIKDHRMFPANEDCGPGLGEIDHYRLLSAVAFTGRVIPLCCENISAPRVHANGPDDFDKLAKRAREFLQFVIAGLQASRE